MWNFNDQEVGGFPSQSGRYGQDKIYLCRELNPESSVVHLVPESRGAQIPGARSPLQINFVRWRLIFVGLQSVTCFMSPFWCLEIWGSSKDFWKIYAYLPEPLYDSAKPTPPVTVWLKSAMATNIASQRNTEWQLTRCNYFNFLWSMFASPSHCSDTCRDTEIPNICHSEALHAVQSHQKHIKHRTYFHSPKADASSLLILRQRSSWKWHRLAC
jgi:hypothetical protein